MMKNESARNFKPRNEYRELVLAVALLALLLVSVI